ncbi:MAG: hypothetical protein COW02_08490 [Comamonadaceae bacterium CG12_big_fil_rev_8_21_14_0_65_59_15]|nr:MAG: hypothetical protein COW02_08490 [Comamonadaceae bacterium CG12_big_fil_rev_8_21_14_0_65_59_15]
MIQAIWHNTVIAQTSIFETVEGNRYFPAGSLNMQYFQPSATHSTCPWKGVASYYHVVVDGQTNMDAAWFYPAPKTAAANIANHVAFWRGVQVVEVPEA